MRPDAARDERLRGVDRSARDGRADVRGGRGENSRIQLVTC